MARPKRHLEEMGKSLRFPRSSSMIEEPITTTTLLPPSPSPPSPPPPLHPTHVPYRRAAAHIISRLRSRSIALPVVGIVCGSGLSGLSDALDDDADSSRITIPYPSIPGFPEGSTTVPGHAGELVVGTLHSVPTICFRGRFHSYEGHSMDDVVLPVRVMRCLGVRLVLVTNAAGGLNDDYDVGDVAVIRDHIALPLLAGKNPLVGPNDDELGPRFPPTSNLYDAALQGIVADVARGLDDFDDRNCLHLDGTYAFVSGPQYESRGECAMLRMMGADAVGMSTVPEVLAAHHGGMAVLCMSLITNKVVYSDERRPGGAEADTKHANHEEVLRAVEGRKEQMVRLVGGVVRRCGEVYLPKLEDLAPICLETEGMVLLGVGGEEEIDEPIGSSSSPFHTVKNMLNAPSQLLVLGSAIFAVGAILGVNIGKHT